MRTVALVSLRGSIDWFCFPHLDSPSVFAALLDAEEGGYLAVRPMEEFEAISEYLDRTNILVTRFRTRSGILSLTDFMPVSSEKKADRERHVLYRLLSLENGTMDLEMHFCPRFDYARAETAIRTIDGGALAEGNGQSLALTSTVPLTLERNGAFAVWRMQEGEKASFKLGTSGESGSCSREDMLPCDLPTTERSLQETAEYWRGWLDTDETGRSMDYRGFREMAERSQLVLKLLFFEPEGTIAAAPTTSLPEVVGGERNWDYRYTWVRDTAFTLQALFNTGHLREIERFLDWIGRIVEQEGAERMQIMYGLRGERELPEATLRHLDGYKGSRPVRVGNAAFQQKQMDIYGELMDAALKLSDYVGKIRAEQWPGLRQICDYVAAHWREPDYGIWEVRGGPWHFVYSKVMCWVALDRGLTIAGRYGFEADTGLWERTRDAIHAEVCKKGYSEEKGAFVQHFETEALDASALLIPLLGFLPFEDRRVVSTVDAVQGELVRNGLVYRYFSEDGLEGEEGAFLLCSFWLVACLAELDRIEEAENLLRGLERSANHLGLFAEEYDPVWKQSLGNFPQAFTHIGFINSVTHLLRARERQRSDGAGGAARQGNGLRRRRIRSNMLLNEGAPRFQIPPENLAHALKSSMNKLRGAFFDTKMGRVAYERMQGSQLYAEYVDAARSLHIFDPGMLSGRKEAIAFWVNLYNVIVIHGVIELGIRDSVKEVPRFFRRIHYDIGGYSYTPDAMEHGMLRANRRPPASPFQVLSPRDPRLRHAVGEVDPRIHFALVCASSSCPPIDIYTAENLDSELDQAGRSFLGGGGLILDRKARKVRLSRIFDWYKKDFGRSLPERLRFLADFLYNRDDAEYIRTNADSLRVEFMPYDWRLNRG
jgi:GH15 family glucan-1,4-alpha-glucosidase